MKQRYTSMTVSNALHNDRYESISKPLKAIRTFFLWLLLLSLFAWGFFNVGFQTFVTFNFKSLKKN